MVDNNVTEVVSLDREIRRNLEELILKDATGGLQSATRGPSPGKTRRLYEHMPQIHEALLSASQVEILEALANAGLSTTRPTFRKVYAKWVQDNQKVPRIKLGTSKKKASAKLDRSAMLARVASKVAGK